MGEISLFYFYMNKLEFIGLSYQNINELLLDMIENPRYSDGIQRSLESIYSDINDHISYILDVAESEKTPEIYE